MMQGFVQGLRKGLSKALAADLCAFARVAIVSRYEGSCAHTQARGRVCAEGAQNPCNLCNPCKAKHPILSFQSLSDFDRARVAQGFGPFVQGFRLASRFAATSPTFHPVAMEVSMNNPDLTSKLASTAVCETSEPADAVSALMGAIATILHPRFGPFGTIAILRDVVSEAEAAAVASVGQQAGESVQ